MKISVFLLSLGVALAVVKGFPREKVEATESLGEGDLEMDDQPSEDIVEKNPKEAMDAQRRSSNRDVAGFKMRKGHCTGYDLDRIKNPMFTPKHCGTACNRNKKCRAFQWNDSAKDARCILKSDSCKKLDSKSGSFVYDRWKVTKNYYIEGGIYQQAYKSEKSCFENCKGKCAGADFSHRWWWYPGCFHHPNVCFRLTYAGKVNHFKRDVC